MSTTIIGFPRLGEFRELKFTTEKYFRKEISADELLAAAKDLRAKHWNIVKEQGISEIPSNDFSHYDNFLDAAFLFNVVPASVQNLDLTDLEQYFALARGYQGEKGDVRALPMKKWFNTNYHYIVPKFEKTTEVKLAGHKIFDEYQEAKELGINTRPVVVGPFTFLQLSDFEDGVKAEDFVDSLVAAYQEVFAKLAELGATRIQLDEPALVKDLTAEEKALFLNLYNKLLADKKGLEVLIQTYFGDVRDVYNDLVNLPVDGIGLDFVEGKKTLELVKGGFPADKILYAGICHSDLHEADGIKAKDGVPVVLGHEIAGEVVAVGKNVTKFKVGDYAGVGCMVDACGHCTYCDMDKEQFCENGTTFTYNYPDRYHGGELSQGGYSDNIVVSEYFAISIPKNADLKRIAPVSYTHLTLPTT